MGKTPKCSPESLGGCPFSFRSPMLPSCCPASTPTSSSIIKRLWPVWSRTSSSLGSRSFTYAGNFSIKSILTTRTMIISKKTELWMAKLLQTAEIKNSKLQTESNRQRYGYQIVLANLWSLTATFTLGRTSAALIPISSQLNSSSHTGSRKLNIRVTRRMPSSKSPNNSFWSRNRPLSTFRIWQTRQLPSKSNYSSPIRLIRSRTWSQNLTVNRSFRRKSL